MTNPKDKSEDSKFETFQNETLPQMEETIKGWADETSKFVKKHPLASLAGALMVGYFIGTQIKKTRSAKGNDQ